MLESLTIFTPGGLVLYQYCANPSLLPSAENDGESFTRHLLNNQLISKILLDPAASTKTYHITDGVTLSWIQQKQQYVCVALYPDILFEGPRQYLKQWAEALLQQTVKEYDVFYASAIDDTNRTSTFRPDPTLFDATFRVLLQNSKTQKQPVASSTAAPETAATSGSSSPDGNSSNSANEKKRQWHDGKAAVTAQAMAALDMSKDDGSTVADAHERALREARAAYLPTDEEVLASQSAGSESSVPVETAPASWLVGLFQQLTGTKVLTEADLVQPIQRMQELLTQKNIAQDLALDIGAAVRKQLVGKRLQSLYTVQTAVQQAVETTVTKLMQRTGSLDLLRAVQQKRGDGSLLTSILGSSKRRPYVITVMGINGIGKTTTLAKLAYYFVQNGCKPMLVAGDTFRSGAVEQLQVHADCLGIPLFQQGYSKNPSAVAAAAIAAATTASSDDGTTAVDVVLIDTAGRMQNNVPLMKALGKLVTDNKPDCCLMVCEALVGHDGVSQYQMFRQAAGRVDGLILTKFDTVDTKMGACLTLTHECGAPIVFLGVGQKYHHLQPLHVSTVIQSLLS
jgi:signal recognition particle receptor subunit alpha